MISARTAPPDRSGSAQPTSEWVLFQLQAPGLDLRPAGILLLDSRTDQLYLSFRTLLADEEDEALREIWGELPEDLAAKAQELGAGRLLTWLEADASHTFQLSSRRQIEGGLADPRTALDELFRRYVLADRQIAEKRLRFSQRIFSPGQVDKAREQVGPLPSATIQLLSLLEDPDLHLRQAEGAVSRDPVLAAHLLRAANLGAYQDSARTLFSALHRLGIEGIKFQVLALTIKKVFSAPAVRKVWDHSLITAQLARQLTQGTTIPPSEAGLLGLVHDIGQIVLFGLGSNYPVRLGELRAQGLTSVQAERTLCGTSHAEIGAALLASWSFPADMVEAVAAHHRPSSSDAPLSALLYLAEAYGENDEDTYDVEQHTLAVQRVNLSTPTILRGATGIDPDLAVLRFAA